MKLSALEGAKLVAVIVAALALVGFAGWAGYTLFVAPGKAKATIAAEKAGATVAIGRQAAAEDATRIVEHYHDRTSEIRTIQNDGVAAVLAAGDAAAGGVAARRAICLLDAGRQLSDPACELFKAGAGVAIEGREGLAASGR